MTDAPMTLSQEHDNTAVLALPLPLIYLVLRTQRVELPIFTY